MLMFAVATNQYYQTANLFSVVKQINPGTTKLVVITRGNRVGVQRFVHQGLHDRLLGWSALLLARGDFVLKIRIVESLVNISRYRGRHKTTLTVKCTHSTPRNGKTAQS
jgi:hypothetical protein